jgi:hypothetical protein
MASKRVLMVLTSHEDMGVSGKKTGNWFDEVATPYYKFKGVAERRSIRSVTTTRSRAIRLAGSSRTPRHSEPSRTPPGSIKLT